MRNILSPRRHVDRVSYSLVCEDIDPITRRVIEPGMGASFPCNAKGEVDESKLAPAGLANLRDIRSGVTPSTPLTVECRKWVETVPAVARCDCGKRVTLDGWTNTCDCGLDYGMDGSRLAPRSQWGYETGEEGTF